MTDDDDERDTRLRVKHSNGPRERARRRKLRARARRRELRARMRELWEVLVHRGHINSGAVGNNIRILEAAVQLLSRDLGMAPEDAFTWSDWANLL